MNDRDPLSPSPTGRAASWLVALVVAAAIVALGRATAGDLAAVGLLIVAAALARPSVAARLVAAALVGIAAGSVVLAGFAIMPLLARANRRMAWLSAAIAIVAGIATHFAVRTFAPTIVDTSAITSGIGELSAPNVWAETARRIDPLTPVMALGLIGAFARLKVGLSAGAAHDAIRELAEIPSGRADPGEDHRSGDAVCARLQVIWLVASTAVVFVWPQYVMAHTLIWMAPFAVLAPYGWAAAMAVLGRSSGMFLRATGMAFLVMLAWWWWWPVRAIRDATLMWWFGS